jgi:hypothetical protein
LNGEIFYSLKEAQIIIERWRVEYNTLRPHSSLGYRPPAPLAMVPATIKATEEAMGHANVETAARFPLLEWSAACPRDGLSCLAGGYPWKSQLSASI